MVIELPTEKNSEEIAQQLATYLQPPLLLTFSGEIGSGKTTFIRAMLRSLGVDSAIKSPTFSLVESYERPQFFIHHFDLYRFQNPYEWDDLGLNDFFSNHTLCLIEWPEKAEALLPPPDWKISLLWVSYGRTAKISAFSNLGESCLKKATISSLVG